MENSILSKIGALALLGGLTLFFGLIPVRIYRLLQDDKDDGGDRENQPASSRAKGRGKRRRYADALITALLQFGGGVLVSTCFLHMLPEVREDFAKAGRLGNNFLTNSTFPFSELFVCIGFFVVYAIEQVAHGYMDSKRTAPTVVDAEANGTLGIATKTSSDNKHPHTENASNLKETSLTSSQDLKLSSSQREAKKLQIKKLSQDKASPSCIAKYGSMESISHAKESGDSTLARLHSSLIIIALSFHAIFEGMAIGLQPTTTDMWTLFVAVAIHKCVIAFCVGLELIAMGMTFRSFFFNMFTLAIVSPIGVAIGIIISYASAGPMNLAHMLVVGIFQALAAGTLIYVTFFEVLGRDKHQHHHHQSHVMKLLSMVLGFLLMAATLALET